MPSGDAMRKILEQAARSVMCSPIRERQKQPYEF